MGGNFGSVRSTASVTEDTKDFVVRFSTIGLVPGDLVEEELVA